jgi:predicted nucleic acid-binding protein
MGEVFADTAGWASAFIRTELHHVKARDLLHAWRHRDVKVITTNYVIMELLSLLISPLRIHHSRRVQIIDAIRTSSWVEVVLIDRAIDEEAWWLLKQRPDKDWSLVDSVSFTVMKKRSIIEAFTSDHHFEQAGFIRLLK